MREGLYTAQVWSFDPGTGVVVGSIEQLFGTAMVPIRPAIVRAEDVPTILPAKTGDIVQVFFQGADDTEPRWIPRVIDPAMTAYYDGRYATGSTFFYEHLQISASTTWTINHNLGAKPNIECTDSSGNALRGGRTDPTNNQSIIYFGYPLSGTATCS